MCLIIFSLSFSINAFAYNSDYLDDTSWVDSNDAVTKTVSCERKGHFMDCSVSYLVDENNSTAYFQVLANNFNITKDSDVRVCFEVFADNQRYSFMLTSQDYIATMITVNFLPQKVILILLRMSAQVHIL